jgi:outer membrane biosynthesis protein TonB
MRWSLASSLGLHAAILVAALVVLPNPNKHDVKPVEAIQVDITNIGDISKKMAMSKDAETPKEKPAPKKTETTKKTDPTAKVAEEVKKVAKEPEAEPPPPEPKKEEPKKVEPKKAEEPKPLDPDPLKDLIKDTVTETPEPKTEPPKKEETKKAEKKPEKKPDKKPEKKKEKLDVDQMEAFLNKIDDESTAPVETSQLDGAPAKGEANLQGTDDQLSATIIQALVQRIRQCWTVPPGAREANVIVKVHFGLNPDGSVSGAPEIMNGSNDPLFDATARSAVAAVLECQSYSFLPQDKYDLWKDLIINFNPNMMFDS